MTIIDNLTAIIITQSQQHDTKIYLSNPIIPHTLNSQHIFWRGEQNDVCKANNNEQEARRKVELAGFFEPWRRCTRSNVRMSRRRRRLSPCRAFADPSSSHTRHILVRGEWRSQVAFLSSGKTEIAKSKRRRITKLIFLWLLPSILLNSFARSLPLPSHINVIWGDIMCVFVLLLYVYYYGYRPIFHT